MQAELQRALSRVADHEVVLTAAGRTDAGVHALAMVAHFDSDAPRPLQAWVLGDPGQLIQKRKPVPVPNKAEVLIRIDAVAICATDLDNIYYGPPALIEGKYFVNAAFRV